MLNYLSWFTTIYAPVFVASVSVNIDGVIDFGPNWKYSYRIEPTEDSYFTNTEIKVSIPAENYRGIKHKRTKRTTSSDAPITMYGRMDPEDIYEKSHAVKEDDKINEFTYHVYKQSLKVFDEIKKKVHPAMEQKVDFIARSYDEKFREFVNETLNQKIKTRLGSQRVVLNVVDTSSRLLNRLVNYLTGDLNREEMLRNNMAATNVFQNEVDRERELELSHACNKFGICRTSSGFTEFMTDVLTIIIKNDAKIKQASDALTEVLKYTDFSKVMDWKTTRKFHHKIELVETFDPTLLKATFLIAKNIFALKNQPINVMVAGSDHINKTVAFIEIIDEMGNQIPSNEENKLEWTAIKTSLSDWSTGTRHDILEIMQELVTHLKTKGIEKLDRTAAQNFNDKFEIIFS